MLKIIPAAVLVSATVLSGAAFAQAPAALVEIPDATTVTALGMTADQIDDMDVHASDGKDIGEVEEIYGPDAATPTHLSVDFDDDNGSTYPDRDDVLVPIENVSASNNQLVIGLNPEQVLALPTHDD